MLRELDDNENDAYDADGNENDDNDDNWNDDDDNADDTYWQNVACCAVVPYGNIHLVFVVPEARDVHALRDNDIVKNEHCPRLLCTRATPGFKNNI